MGQYINRHIRNLYPPNKIVNAPVDELYSLIRDKSHNKLTMKKALSAKEAAASTFSIKIAQSAFAFQLNQLFYKLNLLNQQVEELDAEILKYYKTFDCYLHTIPNISPIIVTCILSEIGDIRRFRNSSSLIAYVDIDPTVKQSGEFCSTRNHMSKLGSPNRRRAIFLAASCCSFHDNPLNDYYKKKRSQGKHHLSAIGSVSNKLTTVIYAVLRDGKPYEPVKFL